MWHVVNKNMTICAKHKYQKTVVDFSQSKTIIFISKVFCKDIFSLLKFEYNYG